MLSPVPSCGEATLFTTTIRATDAGLEERSVPEVNGRSTKEMDTGALRSYLANKAAEEASLVLVYSRNGTQQGSVTIR